MQKRYLTVFLLLLLSLNTSYGEPSSLQRVSEFTISATQTQFNLSWKFIAPAGVTNLDFRIQRKRVQDLDWVALPPVSGTLQALTDSPADGASVDYYYRIRVTGKLNGEFIFSGWKWATPNANRFLPAPPLAITDLRAENVTSSQTELKWTSSTRSERIQIYRKEGTTAGQLVGEVNANSSNFVDRNVTPTRSYTYSVKATNLGGASSASNLVLVTVPAPAPLRPPSSLMLTVLSKTEIELEWADNNPRADNRTLVIERKEPNGEFKPHLEIPLLANTGTDLFGEVPRNRLRSRTYRNIDNVQVEEGGKYSYRIKLKDTYGLGLGALSFESDYSLSETVKVDPLFLSRKVICDWFLGNQRNIAFDGWSNKMTLAALTDEEYGADPKSGNDDYDAFLKMAVDISGSSSAIKESNKVVIIPPGDYSIDRVKVDFNLAKDETPPIEYKNIRNPTVSSHYSPRPEDFGSLTSHQKGSDIIFKNAKRFRILGCGDVKVSVGGNFYRDSPNPMVISPQKIVNNLIRRVPENRRLILDAVVPFKIIESSDFSIEGLELRGNSQLSKRFDVNLESGNSAIRTTASSNYILRDLETHHFNNDGVYIGNGSNSNPSQFIADNNVRIHNVRSHHNTRIAMMFAQARHVHVSSSTMEKSGLNGDDDTANEDYPGLPPMAGVDVEPNTVPLTVTFGTGAQARTYQAEKVNNPDFPDQLLVSLRKNSGNVNMKPVDKMTGHISFENCLFSGNVGRMFQSSLKDENTVPLTEDIAIRHSIFRSSGRETAVTFGLITRNGVVQFNDLELGPGSLSWAHNLGSALHITNQNEHASLIFTNNYLSSSSFITNEWGRQPLVVSNNIFESIHPNNFLAKLARPQDFAFIRVSQNPKAIFHRNTLILSPGLLPATNSSGGPVFQFQFFGRLASENQYQSSSPLPQGDTRKFLISYGRSTSPKRRAEYRNENFSPEFAPQFSPNGDCLWDSTQVTTPTALELPKTWLCRTPPLDQSITTILEYKPYLPDSIE